MTADELWSWPQCDALAYVVDLDNDEGYCREHFNEAQQSDTPLARHGRVAEGSGRKCDF